MPSESNDLLAARAQLLALRASLPEGITVPRDMVRIAPPSRAFTELEAAAELAGRAKPLSCTPAVIDGTLHLQIGPPDPAWARILESVHQWQVSEAGNQDSVGPNATVLLEGRNEELRLTGAAYVAWRRDYVPPDSAYLGGGPPSELERAEGITFVWRAGRTEPVKDEDVPEELRPLLRLFREQSGHRPGGAA